MRAVVQRVTEARVRIGERVTGEIGRGLLVLLGVGRDDSLEDVRYVAGKIRDIRIFEGDNGKGMDRSVVNRLNAEFAKVVRAPEIKNVYEKIGADPLTLSPEETEKKAAAEIAKLGPVVKASGAKVD